MSYDSNGNYSLPPGYLAVTGQTIEASQHNPPLEDIASALSSVLLRSGVAPMTGALNFNGFRAINLGNGVSSGDAVNKGQLDNAIPVGMVADFAGAIAPGGWLMCFGQEISRTTYAALFNAIGTAFGTGDGSTTFNVPDCRGRVAAGKDNMGGTSANRLTDQASGVNGDALGAAGGNETHTLVETELAEHNHVANSVVTDPGHTHIAGSARIAGNPSGAVLDGAGNTFNTSASVTGISVSTDIANTGSSDPHNNVQPTIIFNKMIRTGV